MYPFVFRKCIVKGIIITFSGISDFSGILLNGFDRVITKCGRTFKQNLFIRGSSCCLFHPEGKAGSCRRFVKRCFNAGITFHRQGFADFSFCVSCMFSRHCIVFVLGSITSVFFVKIVFCVSTSRTLNFMIRIGVRSSGNFCSGCLHFAVGLCAFAPEFFTQCRHRLVNTVKDIVVCDTVSSGIDGVIPQCVSTTDHLRITGRNTCI